MLTPFQASSRVKLHFTSKATLSDWK